jgi:hypothetical protein
MVPSTSDDPSHFVAQNLRQEEKFSFIQLKTLLIAVQTIDKEKN